MFIPRRKARVVPIGRLAIGGDHPIAVQSMTTKDGEDLEGNREEFRRLEDAGCEIVRVSMLTRRSVARLPELRKLTAMPVIADVHFHYKLALQALELGVDKLRINPGNLGGDSRYREVLERARQTGTPLRIGVNSGSVEQDLLEKHGAPTPQALVESALRHVEQAEALGFRNLVVAIKSSSAAVTAAANRAFAALTDAPLHLGVTEAGMPGYGSIKSAAGLAPLLLEGIGDTIRISLTGDPAREIPVAYDILKATERRVTSPEIVACPSCGRIKIELEPLVAEVERRLKAEGIVNPLRISILGCVVNGPGEAREADLGIAGGGGVGMLFRRGVMLRKVPEAELVDALMAEIRAEVRLRGAAHFLPQR